MQTVDLSEYIGKQEVRKNDFVSKGYTREVPEDRIIKNHLGGGLYSTLLCTFNKPSFLGHTTYSITEEVLVSEMDKLLGRVFGELDQTDVSKRVESAKDQVELQKAIRTINPLAPNGILKSYEIIKESDSEVINLYGVVHLNGKAIELVESIPHYFSIRSIGLINMRDGMKIIKIDSICAFDLEAALFY
jgi:hypothetical protein